MRIYLDNCAIQRPLDDQSQERIERESNQIIRLLTYFEDGELDFVSSEVLEIEIEKISDEERREASSETLRKAVETILVTPQIRERAHELGVYGIATFDALHIASAENGEVDFFCTTDDKLLKKARAAQNDIKVKVVSPIELMEEF